MTPTGRAKVVKSAGGAVVRTIEAVPHVLLIRDPYDKWGLPKGHAESGEATHETALREVREETGLTDLELGPELLTIDWKFRSQRREIHKFATFYLMFSQQGDPTPQRSEGIRAAEWVRLDAAHARISYPNAMVVIRAVQEQVLDAEGSSPQTGSSRD
jgi:8-oxo-dGTP pyrophosphatase MutT (NUDIX family)